MAVLADDRDANAADTGPLRTCIVTREQAGPGRLIRFALAPDGTVAPDLKGKLPGRGVWVGADRALVEKAAKKNLFSRAFRTPAKADPGLAALVERLLHDDLLGALAMARKAGELILGQDKVDRLARARPLALVIHAADGAADGLRKTRAALTAGGQRDVPVLRAFTAAQLGLALGGTNVIHAAVPAGRMGTALADRAVRLARYSGGGLPSAATEPSGQR